MENQYGIAIKNRFIDMLDVDDDPFELVKQQQDAKAKKEKAPKPKQSGKKTAAQSDTKVKEQNVQKKEEKERTNSAKPSERGGGRGRREPREIRENDGDRRPPRRQGPNKEYREHRGDENVPPEFRDRPEGSSGGFGRDGGERGRGRGRGRGFRGGRGRGGGGGFRNDGDRGGENRERQGFGVPPGKRDFDRHSGSDKTGIKAVEKKDGGGARNWGSYKDDIAEPQENEERPPAEESTENVELNESAEGDQTADAEEQPKQMTLDEWKALQKTERTKPQYKLRMAGEGEENNSQWKKGTAYTKKKVESDEEDEEEDDEDEDEKRHGNKNLLDIKITFNDPVRRGRGGRRPRGARGGRGGSGRGERKPRDSAPRMDDETDFPRLVKTAA